MSTLEQTSFWRRAKHTPARDWVRGRITGRLDWRAAITRAELPDDIAALIAKTVRRSRLWRLEKADLAAELCAHFTDGLEAGKDQETLMKDFGDANRAGRLIGRAKRRGRPAAYRGFVHVCQGLGMLLLAGVITYGVLAWRFFTGEPDIARNYAAEYNETIEAIPEQDRAWPLYVETYAMLDPVPDDLLQNSWPATAPENPLYPEALAYLERQQDVIALTHRAAALPHLGAPMTDAPDPRMAEVDRARNPNAHAPVGTPSVNPMMIGVLLPELGHMRSLARLLTFDAHVAVNQDDADRAFRDIDTMLGVAHHAGDRPTVISWLVQTAIQHLAINTAAQIIEAQPDLFTDEQLRALAHRIAAIDESALRGALQGERWMFEDAVQRVFTDDGDGGGHLTAEGVRQLMSFTSLAGNSEDMIVGPMPLAPITAMLVADRADLTAKYDEMMSKQEARVDLPMWEYDDTPGVSQEVELLAASPIDRVRYFPIVMLMPALDSALQTGQQACQRRDAATAGIALELYRRDQGRYPDALSDLVPEYLPALPLDRFTGRPLRYGVREGSARLWSVGADRNDDGGRPPADDRGDQQRWRPSRQARQDESQNADRVDGDWVLWPIVYQPITGEEDH